MKTASRIYTAIIFVFLFAPIAILLVFSFNESKSLRVFSGFSLKRPFYSKVMVPSKDCRSLSMAEHRLCRCSVTNHAI